MIKQSVLAMPHKNLKSYYKIIDSSCHKNGVVADLFCGSGTTCVAAKELGRRYIGCDISEKAIKIANNRLDKITLN